MFLGHCGLVRGCVGSSGDAVGAPTGRRRRLLDLNARRSDVEWITRGADPVAEISENPKNHRILKCFVWSENWTGWTLDEYNSPRSVVCDENNLEFSIFLLFAGWI